MRLLLTYFLLVSLVFFFVSGACRLIFIRADMLVNNRLVDGCDQKDA